MFFRYSKKVLTINKNYTGWSINFYRRQNSAKYPLVIGYFYQKTINIISMKKDIF